MLASSRIRGAVAWLLAVALLLMGMPHRAAACAARPGQPALARCCCAVERVAACCEAADDVACACRPGDEIPASPRAPRADVERPVLVSRSGAPEVFCSRPVTCRVAGQTAGVGLVPRHQGVPIYVEFGVFLI